PGFHQDHATSLGKTRLATIALAVHQFQQFLAQHAVAEQVGQADDRLLHGADPPHHFRTLLQQLAKFVMRLPHYFLHMTGPIAPSVLRKTYPALPVFHTESPVGMLLSNGIPLFPYETWHLQVHRDVIRDNSRGPHTKQLSS